MWCWHVYVHVLVTLVRCVREQRSALASASARGRETMATVGTNDYYIETFAITCGGNEAEATLKGNTPANEKEKKRRKKVHIE